MRIMKQFIPYIVKQTQKQEMKSLYERIWINITIMINLIH